MFHSILSVLHTDASHFIAALLVMFYASGRFNTPRSVRSQTSRFQYFGSCVTYVLSCEGILFALTWALQQQQPDILNLLHVGAEGPLQSDVVGLQTPLLAALTAALPLPNKPGFAVPAGRRAAVSEREWKPIRVGSGVDRGPMVGWSWPGY